MSLGWGLGRWVAEYKLNLPRLSPEEEALALGVAERFRNETQKRELKGDDEAAALCKKLLYDACEEEGLEIDSEQEAYLSRAVFLQTFGSGFLGELLADEKLEEIALIGLQRPVFVYVRGSGWKRTNVYIDSQDYFVSLCNRLGRGLGRRLTAQQPRINAVLDDGSRMHASMPPVSSCELTIRKFSREPLSPFDLLQSGTYDAKMLAFLSLSLQADLSVVFAGNTASGKTTTLNAALSFIPDSERLLLIEETPEISVPHSHQLRLMPFEEAGIGMVELVRDSLRMRPDRVVVGEVRRPDEAHAFVESALSGQAKGCYATFHAQSSRDALLRLRMMGCLEADLEGLDLVVIQRRVSTYDRKQRKVGEARKVTEISLSNRQDILHPNIVFSDGKFSEKPMALALERFCSNSGMTLRESREELSAREKFFLQNRACRGFERSFGTIQKYMFGGKKNG
ncbi:MAG: type II/IV secretion system ATPase subunit [Candidatus Micrarchaeia archaeon]